MEWLWITNDIQHHTTMYTTHTYNIVKYTWRSLGPRAKLSVHNAQIEKSTEEPPAKLATSALAPDLNLLEEQIQLGLGKIERSKALKDRNDEIIWNQLSWQSFRRVTPFQVPTVAVANQTMYPKRHGQVVDCWWLKCQRAHCTSALWSACFPSRKSEKPWPWPSGWWFQPLWKILVSWDDSSQHMEK